MNSIQTFGYRIIQIEVTNRCNMACSFCPLPIRDTPLLDISLADVIHILEQLRDIGGIDYVAFHQFGETLLYPEIWKCLDFCRAHGLRTQLVTNGMLFNDKAVHNILAHPPNILRVSLQTLNPEHHQATRGSNMAFDYYSGQIALSLAKLLGTCHQIEEIRTDVAVNEDLFQGISGKASWLAARLGITDNGDPTIYNETPRTMRPHLIRFVREVSRYSTDFEYSQQHLDDCIERYYRNAGSTLAYQFSDINTITYKKFWNGRKISSFYPVEHARCGTEIIGILADGTVTCCCVDYEGFTGLGNIFKTDLITILEDNKDIIDGLHRTGNLHFQACKKCLGSPTRHGAWIKNAINSVTQ